MINNLQSTFQSASGRKYCKLMEQKENSGERRKEGKDTKKQNLGRVATLWIFLRWKCPFIVALKHPPKCSNVFGKRHDLGFSVKEVPNDQSLRKVVLRMWLTRLSRNTKFQRHRCFTKWLLRQRDKSLSFLHLGCCNKNVRQLKQCKFMLYSSYQFLWLEDKGQNDGN